jgi:hypothetical protein
MSNSSARPQECSCDCLFTHPDGRELLGEILQVAARSLPLMLRENMHHMCLSSNELYLLAKGKTTPEAHGLVGEAVYIFLCLLKEWAVKIGTSDDLTQRMLQHLVKKPCGLQHSEVREYYSARGEPWPGIIFDDELALVVLCMPGSDRRERLDIERWLTQTFVPWIRR